MCRLPTRVRAFPTQGHLPNPAPPPHPLRPSRHYGHLPILALACLLLVPPARTQWLTQEIPLVPGWNAVFLRVQPDPATCNALLDALPVTAVYQWNGRDRTLQFTAAPDRLLPREDDWLFWLPAPHPQAALNNLHTLHANRACLIRVAADTPAFTWRIKGHPRLFQQTWQANALNLSGLPVPARTATFAGVLQPCPAIPLLRAQGGDLQSVNPLGHGTPIWTPSLTRVEPGRAYWIRSTRSTSFTGPLHVETDSGTALDFVLGRTERTLTLRNQTGTALPVTLRLRPSEPPPAGLETAPSAGLVPLNRREKDWSTGRPRTLYHPFDAPLERTLAAGESWELTLVLRERDLVDDPPDSVRLGLLEITGGPHFQDTIGVIAYR